MTILKYVEFSPIIDCSGKTQYLTYAEEGFSPLNLYLAKLDFEKQEIENIANEVNSEDRILQAPDGVPLFVLPSRFVREIPRIQETYKILYDFLVKCDEFEETRHIICCFMTPKTPWHIEESLARVTLDFDFKRIESVGIAS